MPSSASLSRIGQIHVPVVDLVRAVAFYRDTLGVRFLFEVPGMAFFDLSGVRLMLGVPESPHADPSDTILYYQVDDIVASHQALASAEVDFQVEPRMIADMEDHELWMAFFQDSEGNQLALMAEVRADG